MGMGWKWQFCLKAGLLALTGLWPCPQQLPLPRDQLCSSQIIPASQEPGPWAKGAQDQPSIPWEMGTIPQHSSSVRAFGFIYDCKHVAGGSDPLRPPGTAAEQIIAWNLFWVRYFLSVVLGLN